MLGIKLETMVDCIDNYDKIYALVQTLAQQQYNAGEETSKRLKDDRCFDLATKNIFPNHFAVSKDRIGLVTVLSIYGYVQWVWDGIQEEEKDYCENWNYRFGKGWENNVPYDKIRKSLWLE